MLDPWVIKRLTHIPNTKTYVAQFHVLFNLINRVQQNRVFISLSLFMKDLDLISLQKRIE